MARILVRHPELLVLDDLSSLDGPTENALWSQLRADRSATILAASHRRAVLTRADRILVLADGLIVDRPHSSGEALARFRDDVDETSLFLIPFNDLIAWTLFALVGLVVMISVNPTITIGVFLPLVAISALVHAGRTRKSGQLSPATLDLAAADAGRVMISDRHVTDLPPPSGCACSRRWIRSAGYAPRTEW